MYMPYPVSNAELIAEIRRRSSYYLETGHRSEAVLSAMLKVDRRDFIPEPDKDEAYHDTPLSIGCGQTCSEPSMVAFMLEKLELKPELKVLEIGAVCGYAGACIIECIRPNGSYIGIEVIPELAELARRNLASRMEFAEILTENGSKGFPERAPYDRILLSAGVSKHFDPEPLLAQLTDGGILLYPEAFGNLYCLRISKGKIQQESWHGVGFVPLRL